MAPKAKAKATAKAKAAAKVAAQAAQAASQALAGSGLPDSESVSSEPPQLSPEALLTAQKTFPQQAATSQDPNVKEAYAYYQSLPLRCDAKRLLLAKWKANKSCTWIHDFVEVHSSILREQQNARVGWTTAPLIAKELNMDAQSPEFQQLLTSLPQESYEKWSDAKPVERAFKMLKMPRLVFCFLFQIVLCYGV
jgi:hypothetical protein